MQRGLAEVIVGYRRDLEVGPIVMLGMGGITAEISRSRTVRLAPITLATAHEMIGEVRELAILCGFRNLPRGDIDALAASLRAISLLAHVESAHGDRCRDQPADREAGRRRCRRRRRTGRIRKVERKVKVD